MKYIFSLLVPDIDDVDGRVTLGHSMWLSEKVERERLKMDLGAGNWCLKIIAKVLELLLDCSLAHWLRFRKLHEKFPPMKGKTSLWPPLSKSSSSTSWVHPECDADEPKQKRKEMENKNVRSLPLKFLGQ